MKLVRRVVFAAATAWSTGCGRRSTEAERIVDRAYDGYEAIARAFDGERSCQAAVTDALREVARRRPDLEAAFALQADRERLAAARSALESRLERYLAISSALDAAFIRCDGTPGMDQIEQALGPR